MKIAMDKLCYIFSRAFDIIEEEQIGASEYHSMRIAALCAAMGKCMGYGDDAISAIVTCALFHDNALTEHNLSIMEDTEYARNMVLHCEKGQKNASWLPFKKNIDGYILYHHERGDGKGPFHKREGDFPFEAALIGVADAVDVTYHLQRVPDDGLAAIRDKIAAYPYIFSTRTAVDILLEILDEEMLFSLRDENIAPTLERSCPRWEADLHEPDIICAAEFIAHVIDCKSVFTRKHTSQIANRSWLMAGYYGYEEVERAALFIAASLHDIGKIAIPTEILEKPGRLNNEEFRIIKQHVRKTYEWLSHLPDADLIRNWAADHHEKLDGSGYSFGKTGAELDFNARLIACLDIYQAVGEPRPYHGARTHEETMAILYDMAVKKLVDGEIAKDVDKVMCEYSMVEVPSPIDTMC